MAKQKVSFEKAMGRLEQIVESIETGKVGLEDAIKQYEEGMKLIGQCRQVLTDAELKIQQIQAAEGGQGVAVSGFEGLSDADG